MAFGYPQKKSLAQGIISDDPDPEPDNDRVDSDAAGYMELEGAEKDADCDAVEVDGGVSSALGYCNLFRPADQAQAFSCGTCTHIGAAEGSADDDEQTEPATGAAA